MPRKVSHGLDYDDDYDDYDDYDYYDNDFDVEEKGKKVLSLITFKFVIFHNFSNCTSNLDIWSNNID